MSIKSLKMQSTGLKIILFYILFYSILFLFYWLFCIWISLTDLSSFTIGWVHTSAFPCVVLRMAHTLLCPPSLKIKIRYNEVISGIWGQGWVEFGKRSQLINQQAFIKHLLSAQHPEKHRSLRQRACFSGLLGKTTLASKRLNLGGQGSCLSYLWL